jgi:hypothetical protein
MEPDQGQWELTIETRPVSVAPNCFEHVRKHSTFLDPHMLVSAYKATVIYQFAL